MLVFAPTVVAVCLMLFASPAAGQLHTLGLDTAQKPLTATTQPNVVFFHSDDHGWADVGFRGSVIETPHIDSLAAGGLALQRYHTYPICGPTRVGLMTGRNPITVGITGNIGPGDDGVPLDENMLPETFQSAGYQTWMMGKWHLGGTTSPDYQPQNRGFDYFYGFLGGSIDETTHTTAGTGNLDWQRNGVDVPEDDGQLSTDLMASEAISLIQSRDPERPFFLYVAFHALHTPYDAPQELKDKYALKGLSGQALEYAAMAENMDRNIGRVLDELRSQGLFDDALVVFASDNGAQAGKGGSNLPLNGWKGGVFEGGHRTPAVVHWPGRVSAGKDSEQFLSHVDWLPTLAAAVGVPPVLNQPLDGVDRWSELAAGTEMLADGFPIERGQGRAALAGRWKALRETNNGPWQLYDAYTDPSETQDLAAAQPELVSAMMTYLEPCTGAVSHWGSGGAGSAGLVPSLSLLGCPQSSETVVLDLARGRPSSYAVLLYGLDVVAGVPMGTCPPLVSQVMTPGILVPLDTAGEFILPVVLPASAPALPSIALQAFVADDANPWGYSSTNAVRVDFGP